MSRPRTPISKLRLQHSGNIGRAMRREAQDVPPKFSPGAPSIPAGLNEAERKIWGETVKILSDRGVLDTGDGPILEHYVVTRSPMATRA